MGRHLLVRAVAFGVSLVVFAVLAIAFLAVWHATGHHEDAPALPYFLALLAILIVAGVLGRGIWLQRRRGR